MAIDWAGMERRLIVMRHAKSSWSSKSETDHDRPLNDRGRTEAPRVASLLMELDWVPQFVLSSDARRTRETLARMQSVWPEEIPAEFLRALYLAGYSGVSAAAGLVPTMANTLMVLGHNPGLEEVVFTLSGQSVELKTATAALLENEADNWIDGLASRSTWRLIDVIRGREMGDED